MAVRVGEHLDLDVARPGDEPLDEHRTVAERGGRLAAAALERLGEIGRGGDGAHPAPPPPAAALSMIG